MASEFSASNQQTSALPDTTQADSEYAGQDFNFGQRFDLDRPNPAEVRRISQNQGSLSPKIILNLQRSHGNQAVMRLLAARRANRPAQVQRAGEATATKADAGENPSPQQEREKKYLGASINRPKAYADLAEVKKRISHYPNINTPLFNGYLDKFVNALIEVNVEEVKANLQALLNYLDKQRSFEIGFRSYKMIGQDEELRDASAKEAVKSTQLWSKLNKYISLEEAEAQGGVSLEASIVGHIFDNLDFGAKYAETDLNLLCHQWREISARFMSHVEGVVHARIFRKLVKTSVLYHTEWEKIKRMMPGQIKELIIHVYDFATEGDPKSGLAEMYNYRVRNVEEWNKLPVGEGTEDEFKSAQGGAHGGENERHSQKKAANQAQKKSATEQAAQQIDFFATDYSDQTPALMPEVLAIQQEKVRVEVGENS